MPRSSAVEVFECDRFGTHRIMKVVKQTNRRQLEALEREALILQMIEHPGIPRSRRADFFTFTPAPEVDSLCCLVMEKMEGQTLEDWVEANGPATEAQIIDWLHQISDILRAVHELEFVHCDIKPDNLILRPTGELALIDFGAVAMMSESRSITMGTVRYMAPEQVEGTPVFQSDFFSLGRTAIRLATGVPLQALAKDSHTGLLLWRSLAPQIDQPLADLLDQMTSPTPGLRPPRVQALVAALDEIPKQNERLRRRRMLRSRPALAFYSILFILLGFAVYRGVTMYAAGVYYRWGLQDQGNGLLQGSLVNLKKSIQLDPGNAEAHDSLGLTCQELGDNICAVKQFQKAIDLDETLWTAHYNLGNLYDDQKAYALAQRQYTLAMQYGPENTALPINNLARLKNLGRKYEEAAKLSQQGLKQTDERFQKASLYKNLGWAYLGMDDYKAARQYLQMSTNLASESADAFCLLVQVHNAMGDRAEAKRCAQSCLLLNSENPEVRQWRDEILGGLYIR